MTSVITNSCTLEVKEVNFGNKSAKVAYLRGQMKLDDFLEVPILEGIDSLVLTPGSDIEWKVMAKLHLIFDPVPTIQFIDPHHKLDVQAFMHMKAWFVASEDIRNNM
jgi:hypothetical protein